MSKQEKYDYCLQAIRGVCDGEPDITANLANTAAILKEVFGWWWVGFYRVHGDELLLGPFQGPTACTRISRGKGVCGQAWSKAETIIVDDVNLFPGHIACSAESKSEIVVPVIRQNEVVGVLDADSEFYSTYDNTDRKGLEAICTVIAGFSGPLSQI